MNVEDVNMSFPTPSINLSQPGPGAVRADLKKLFLSLASAVIGGAIQQWGQAAAKFAEALTAFDLRDPGALAWLLLQRSLVYATYELAAENQVSFVLKHPPEAETLDRAVEKALDELARQLETSSLTLTVSLLEDPGSLPLLRDLQPAFAEWLTVCGLSEDRAAAVASRLRPYFVAAFRREWLRHPELYQPLAEALRGPAASADARERSWLAYHARLRKQVEEPVMGQAFGLSQLYVRLRAGSEPPGTPAARGYSRSGAEPEPRVLEVMDLEEELDRWLADPAGPRLRIVSGGPGSGKSSSVRMYAARLAARMDRRILFIPLYLLDPRGQLTASLEAYGRETELFPEGVLATGPDAPDMLLIFDGLDELERQGKSGADAAREFVAEVERILRLAQAGPAERRTDIRAIITGRELSVQSLSTGLQAEARVLHVLPYRVLPEPDRRYLDPQNRLAVDQRHKWWQKYGQAAGKGFEGMPDRLDRPDTSGRATPRHPIRCGHVLAGRLPSTPDSSPWRRRCGLVRAATSARGNDRPAARVPELISPLAG